MPDRSLLDEPAVQSGAIYLMPEPATLQLLRDIRRRGTINGLLIFVLLVGFALYAVSQDQRTEARLDVLEAWQTSELDFRERWRTSFQRWLSRQPQQESDNAQPEPTDPEAASAPDAGPDAGP